MGNQKLVGILPAAGDSGYAKKRCLNRQFATRFIQIELITIVQYCYYQEILNFLTFDPIKTYGVLAPEKSPFFDTDMQVGGNYGGRFF